MTRGKFLVGAVAATLAFGVSPALAQRTSSGGESTGSAVSRGGDSGGGAVSRGGDSGPSSSSGSSSGSSSSSGGRSSDESYSAPSSSSTPAAREYISAPTRPSERAERAAAGQRHRDGGGSGESAGRAVPRGDSGSRGASEAPGRSAGASTASSEGSNPSNRAVPTYSRPRDGRPQIGTAVERMTPRPDGTIYPYVPYYGSYYNGYYGSGRYYWPGAFGLGFYYDPLWYDPFYYDPLGGYGYYGGGYGNPYGGYQGGYGAGSYSRVGTGSVRLKIKPRDAQVYVDGYYVGTVDQFDGLFQKLSIDGGAHRLEIRAEGHESIQLDVFVTPGETVTYKGELKRIH